MTPETVLPVLKWLAIASISASIIGGAVAGYLDYRRSATNERRTD